MAELRLNKKIQTYTDNKNVIHSQGIGGDKTLLDGPTGEYLLCNGMAFDSLDNLIAFDQRDLITCSKCIAKLKRLQKELNQLF